MSKKTITNSEYLKLLGILTLVEHYETLLKGLEEAAYEITGEEERWGHTSDAIFDKKYRDVDTLLHRLNITVEEEDS